VGRRPFLAAGLGLAVCCGLCLGWLEVLRRDPVQKTEDLEELWSVRGGQVAQEIRWVKELRDDEPWDKKLVMTFFVGKGARRDQDMLRPEVLAELLPLFGRLQEVSVTTGGGRTYGMRDLCARGSTPDYPGDPAACAAWEATNRSDAALQAACFPTPVMPCIMASALECFRDHLVHLDPSYQAIDPLLPQLLAGEPTLAAAPYATRPSFRNLTAAEVRAEVSTLRPATGTRGCPHWIGALVFQPPIIGGGITWNAAGTLMEEMNALSWGLFMEAPRRARFRLSLAKPELADEAEIDEALELWYEAWTREVEAFAGRSEAIEAVVLTPDAADEANDANTKPQWGLMVLGGLLMWAFMAASLADWRHPLLSRVNVAHAGLLPVSLAMGASSGAVLLAGMKLNTAIIMGAPFLALGLGVDDLFVLIRCFSGLGVRFVTERETPEIIGAVFREAGTGVTLTSLCNVAGFAAGALVPVPAMADFSIVAAVVATMNYLVMLTAVPGLLALEVRRIKRREAEPHLLTWACHRRALRRAAAAGEELAELTAAGAETCEARLVGQLKARAAPALASAAGRAATALLAAGLVAVSVWSIAGKSVGYRPKDLVPGDSKMSRPLELLFERYTNFPSLLCFVDVDVPAQQAEMLSLLGEITSLSTAAPSETPPYLSFFYGHLWQQNQTLLDASWTHPVYAPLGIATSDPETFYSHWARFSRMPLDNPLLGLAADRPWATADLAGVNEFAHATAGRQDTPLRFSFFHFYQTNLKTDQDYLDNIKAVRALVDASPLRGKAFPYGVIYTFWSVFMELEPALGIALGIDMGIIALCTLVLLRSVVAALVSSLACALIVLEVYGICMLFLQFNMFIAAALLACAGISVEFTAHLVAAFYLEDSGLAPVQRLGEGLARTGPAVIQGSLSTLLGILPLAFAPVPFVGKYMFAPFALIVGVGMLNGLLVLPSLLVLAGRGRGAAAAAGAAAGGAAAAGDAAASGKLPSLLVPAGRGADAAGAKAKSADVPPTEVSV